MSEATMFVENRLKLVVIGNGMAGARIVEEILERNRLMFDITMIGDEPHGNYNRILLSDVLNGAQQPQEITLNSIEWYQENRIKLLAGMRAIGIDCANRRVKYSSAHVSPVDAVTREIEYDKLIIA